MHSKTKRWHICGSVYRNAELRVGALSEFAQRGEEVRVGTFVGWCMLKDCAWFCFRICLFIVSVTNALA